MDDESKIGAIVKAGAAALGLGVIATALTVPKFGLWIAITILLLAVLLFGGYYLFRRLRARRERERFSAAIEVQTSAAPKSISDPTKRAELDRVRQKFQSGMQEFKSRGKDIYKLPWFVFIGESGSGKTEAIRHSGVDFPPGLQDELQGSGGTVNMDWWFTNRGIILDTAGAMLFNETQAGESPEWKEFLRLLRKARPNCPINGLFLVLSIESLIRDSADTIAQKASRIAQQLDLVQRTLDVRFPVYLLVTKCDLLTGFREFFDSIDDPLLQHQMFGWSNPDPLDAHFRPDLVEQHLKGVAARLQRRRMALLRDTSAAVGRLGDTQQFFATSYQGGRGATTTRRLDDVDAMFALPESVMRLVPRLRRYLETIFVAGEWSAKPVFLRGIYFTSSMREGKALDEAIAFATGLNLDQLPEEDRTWDKNRAFFLRDLFLEKVFRESGLVTRATNTLKLLRQRQIAIFGTAGVALVLLVLFAGLAYRKLNRSVLAEADYWQAGATNWTQGVWSPAIVAPGGVGGASAFVYTGTNVFQAGKRQLSVVEYHQRLRDTVQHKFSVGFIFKPMVWLGFGEVRNRPEAQRVLFEGGVVRPLVRRTREKMTSDAPPPQDSAGINRHKDALMALIQLEAEGLARGTNSAQKAERFLRSLVSYVTEAPHTPETNLVDVFVWTYGKGGSGAGEWPPESVLGGKQLSENPAIQRGLGDFRKANQAEETKIVSEVQAVNSAVDALATLQRAETDWLQGTSDLCAQKAANLAGPKAAVDEKMAAVPAPGSYTHAPLTNASNRYAKLEQAATQMSTLSFATITSELPEELRGKGIIGQISEQLRKFASEAGGLARSNYQARSRIIPVLDGNYLLPVAGVPLYEARWSLYGDACAIASARSSVEAADPATAWTGYASLVHNATRLLSNLATYTNLMADSVSNVCIRIAGTPVALLEGMDSALTRKSAFPVALNANSSLDESGLLAFKKFIEQSDSDLTNTVWLRAAGTKAPEALKARVAAYRPVVRGLVIDGKSSDAIAHAKISFIPHKMADGSDFDFTKVYRRVKLKIGSQETDEREITRQADQAIPLGETSLSQGITFTFVSDRGTVSETVADWTLLRMIRDGKAKVSADGKSWRVRFKPTGGPESKGVVFEFNLDQPIPKLEDWPKS
jgi:hypothetical protein